MKQHVSMQCSFFFSLFGQDRFSYTEFQIPECYLYDHRRMDGMSACTVTAESRMVICTVTLGLL